MSCCGIVDPSPYQFICRDCEKKIGWIWNNFCDQCGAPIQGEVEPGKVCPQCKQLEPAFDQGRSIFHLDGPGRDFVHTFKYRGGTFLRQDIKALVLKSPECGDFLTGGYLVPVPLHKRKERERGYNQSTLLVKELQKQFSNLNVIMALQRWVDTVSQTCLNRESRIKNMKNAFSIRPKTVINPNFRYVLVDDVFTTGATLSACARVLKQAGAKQVDVFTLAHG